MSWPQCTRVTKTKTNGPQRPSERYQPLADARYANKLTGMVESGVWGHAYWANIFFAPQSRHESLLPLGGIRHVRKLYVYLNADATLIVNGARLPMVVSREGYWEMKADAAVQSLAIEVDHVTASGKYCVFGTK